MRNLKHTDRVQGNIRYNSGDDNGVTSGYKNHASTLTIPACTIEDVDRAVMALFDNTIGFNVSARDSSMNKVPVIFATGERFALLNRNKPIRDKEGKLILPLISIRRTSIRQSSEDMSGRGMNQHTGDIVVKKRLSNDDRNYQRLVNKLGIQNQDGLANYQSEPNPVGSDTPTGEITDDTTVIEGGLLKSSLGNNVFEVISIPQPQFYTAEFEISLWAQYTQQMNEMLEQLMNAQLPQGRAFRLNTDKGYWFVLNLDESKSSNDNFQDFSEKERIVKYTFNATVPAYLISGGDNSPKPVRRVLSSPRIRFDVYEQLEGYPEEDPAFQDNDPTLPLTLNDSTKRRTDYVPKRLRDSKLGRSTKIIGPNGKIQNKFVRVLQETQKVGETVYSGDPLIKLTTLK